MNNQRVRIAVIGGGALGMKLEELKSKARYASGEDSLKVTEMAVVVHKSIEEKKIIEL